MKPSFSIFPYAIPTCFSNCARYRSEGDDVQGKSIIFSVSTYALKGARAGRNPHTGETLTIPVRKTPAFKARKALKEAENAK
ncbi:HU family DNA-binding protein [Bacillus sp. FSL K6-0268]|uniref:HU family DNA-binding protein n=1 Tax=Bacillus sp. FSL K6-0268 TaxID=2921449 RepID=UPI004046F685